MPDAINLSFAMGLPPRDAVAYFESKGYAVTWDWKEMDAAAHARAFTVAKCAQLDVLKDIREACAQALKEGKTEAWFLKHLEPKLRERGWWGKQPMTDPRTGEERRVQLGSPARLRLIYAQNMQTAYMTGRYKQMLENADARPWWQYVAVLDSRTRPSHRVLSGLTFRYDDPFWSSHYPPNGWRCRCRVRALSDYRLDEDRKDAQREAEEQRAAGKEPAPDARLLEPQSGVGRMVTEDVTTVDRATKQEATRRVTGYKTDSGYVAFTDVGFSSNPGASWMGTSLDDLVRKLEAAPLEIARATVKEMTASPTLATWLERPVGSFPLVVVPEADAALIGAKCQVGRLSQQTAGKQLQNHPELTPGDYAAAQDAVEQGERYQDGARSLVYLLNEPGGVVVAVKATVEGDELFVLSVRRMSEKEAKRDEVVRRLKRKSAR